MQIHAKICKYYQLVIVIDTYVLTNNPVFQNHKWRDTQAKLMCRGLNHWSGICTCRGVSTPRESSVVVSFGNLMVY